MSDYDNDGDPDLYLTHFGPNRLYRNNGDGTFSDVTGRAGVAGAEWSTGAAFFDYDRDGAPDLYVVNYLDATFERNPPCEMKGIRAYCHPRHFAGVPDRLYRNLGDGRFRDVSRSSGILNPEGKGLGVVAADFDGDGWVDLYVANDSVRNVLLRNKGDGTFSDVTLLSGTGYNSQAQAEAGMGVDAADYDGGQPAGHFRDQYDLETNALYRYQGNWLFGDERWRSGLARKDRFLLGFGAGFWTSTTMETGTCWWSTDTWWTTLNGSSPTSPIPSRISCSKTGGAICGAWALLSLVFPATAGRPGRPPWGISTTTAISTSSSATAAPSRPCSSTGSVHAGTGSSSG